MLKALRHICKGHIEIVNMNAYVGDLTSTSDMIKIVYISGKQPKPCV